jgi:hypothetical protein
MCSCGQGKTFTQIVQQDGSSLPTLKYLHCKHKDQFEALFAKIGIDASEAKLPQLAAINDNGLDKTGAVKDTKGNPIFFSVEETLKKIDTSRIANNNCAI